MNRVEFQRLAEVRLREAEALLAAGLWDGAYYLAGYVVECGLKACILARVEREGVMFDEAGKKFSEQCWTHNLADLLRLAGLQGDFEAAAPPATQLAVNWVLVRSWTEAARYRFWSGAEATAYLDAVANPVDGVLSWIRPRW